MHRAQFYERNYTDKYCLPIKGTVCTAPHCFSLGCPKVKGFRARSCIPIESNEAWGMGPSTRSSYALGLLEVMQGEQQRQQQHSLSRLEEMS
jgi:hypothetical protein